MSVKEFIEAFIRPNTLIRLQYKIKGGHREVVKGDKLMMEHELIRGRYANRTVIGVTAILYPKSHYKEAVNLVIKRQFLPF